MGQVIDTETAREFMKETLERVDEAELSKICSEVEAKSAWFRERLAPGSIPGLSADDFLEILGRVFSVRRKASALVEGCGVPDLRAWTGDLLYGDGVAAARFDSFVARLEGPEGLEDNVRRDLAGELLHFSQPERYWLWARWMWDPKTRTGALPLVTTAAYDLQGETPGEIYLKVGQAVAFVHEVGGAAGFQIIRNNTFGTDVFLCCVYVVYAYTVLRMRMTQEFNKVIPGLPEFSRRLLGVHVASSRPAARPASAGGV